jgi:hypothetical protein
MAVSYSRLDNDWPSRAFALSDAFGLSSLPPIPPAGNELLKERIGCSAVNSAMAITAK